MGRGKSCRNLEEEVELPPLTLIPLSPTGKILALHHRTTEERLTYDMQS